MKMSTILKCNVIDCAYNTDKNCHAIAITVGGPKPCCDTFIRLTNKGGIPTIKGGVGACKVENCQYNGMLECMAQGIDIGFGSCIAECLTFKSKPSHVK